MILPRRSAPIGERRLISLAISVVGLAIVAFGIAASPASAIGGNGQAAVATVLWAAFGPIFGAATAGYAIRRSADLERAPQLALGFGTTAAVILVATFGLAAVIQPAVRGAGIGDVWYDSILFGLLVASAGALLWSRDPGDRRFVLLGVLGLYLLVGWVISSARGDWSAASQDFLFSATGTGFLALAAGRPTSRQIPARQAT